MVEKASGNQFLLFFLPRLLGISVFFWFFFAEQRRSGGNWVQTIPFSPCFLEFLYAFFATLQGKCRNFSKYNSKPYCIPRFWGGPGGSRGGPGGVPADFGGPSILAFFVDLQALNFCCFFGFLGKYREMLGGAIFHDFWWFFHDFRGPDTNFGGSRCQFRGVPSAEFAKTHSGSQLVTSSSVLTSVLYVHISGRCFIGSPVIPMITSLLLSAAQLLRGNSSESAKVWNAFLTF